MNDHLFTDCVCLWSGVKSPQPRRTQSSLTPFPSSIPPPAFLSLLQLLLQAHPETTDRGSRTYAHADVAASCERREERIEYCDGERGGKETTQLTELERGKECAHEKEKKSTEKKERASAK